MILDELLAIPADATNATVQGVEMKVISNERAEMLLNNDAEDEKTHDGEDGTHAGGNDAFLVVAA
jgi:hypothetical protein